jgi:hypothetical protein
LKSVRAAVYCFISASQIPSPDGKNTAFGGQQKLDRIG